MKRGHTDDQAVFAHASLRCAAKVFENSPGILSCNDVFALRLPEDLCDVLDAASVAVKMKRDDLLYDVLCTGLRAIQEQHGESINIKELNIGP